MSDDNLIDQDEIEKLLNGGGGGGGDAQAEGDAAPTADPQAAQAAASGDDPDIDQTLDQRDIEALLAQSGTGPAAPGSAGPPAAAPAVPAAAAPVGGAPLADNGGVQQGDIEQLLQQAEAAIASIENPTDDLPDGVREFQFEAYQGTPASADHATLDLMRDVELDVKIELGRTHMYLEDVLKLRRGWVVPLDKLAGDPVDIYVNGRLVARGEVLVMNDNFCVRVAELITGSNTMQARETG